MGKHATNSDVPGPGRTTLSPPETSAIERVHVVDDQHPDEDDFDVATSVTGEDGRCLSLEALRQVLGGQLGLQASLRALVDALGSLSGLHTQMTRHPTERCLGVIEPGDLLLYGTGVTRIRDRRSSSPVSTERARSRYAASEVKRRRNYDQQADIFSIGVLLWDMLGGLNFQAEKLPPAPSACQKLEQSLEPWSRPLVAVARRAMSANPEDRHASAREMRRAVEIAAGAANLASRANVAAVVEGAILAGALPEPDNEADRPTYVSAPSVEVTALLKNADAATPPPPGPADAGGSEPREVTMITRREADPNEEAQGILVTPEPPLGQGMFATQSGGGFAEHPSNSAVVLETEEIELGVDPGRRRRRRMTAVAILGIGLVSFGLAYSLTSTSESETEPQQTVSASGPQPQEPSAAQPAKDDEVAHPKDDSEAATAKKGVPAGESVSKAAPSEATANGADVGGNDRAALDAPEPVPAGNDPEQSELKGPSAPAAQARPAPARAPKAQTPAADVPARPKARSGKSRYDPMGI